MKYISKREKEKIEDMVIDIFFTAKSNKAIYFKLCYYQERQNVSQAEALQRAMTATRKFISSRNL